MRIVITNICSIIVYDLPKHPSFIKIVIVYSGKNYLEEIRYALCKLFMACKLYEVEANLRRL